MADYIAQVRRFARRLARHRNTPMVRRVRRVVAELHKGLENLNYDLNSNGERWVLEQIARIRSPEVALDVGANHGDWSVAALAAFPGATVHAFEIAPHTFAQLKDRLATEPRVRLNNLGLSAEAGEIDFYYSAEQHEIATPVAGFSEDFHSLATEKLRLPVGTGDQYCDAQNIRQIDFLKIDVEGHEPQVLQGFESMLARSAIHCIQFEYGYVNIAVNFLLRDFHALLERYDMCLGKIFPDHVDFREYRHVHEDFYGPNFLAVHRSRKDLIEALRCR